MGEYLVHRALLHDTPGVHDHHVVRHLSDDTQVVGDEHDGGIDLILQVAQQIQYLRLDGHVQGRGRLIGDDDPGAARQGHGDHDALAHTAGQLVGEVLIHALAVGDAHHLQQLDGALLDLLLGAALVVVEGDDLVQLVADAEHRVQGGHGLLENHGDRVAPQVLHDLIRRFRHVVGLIAQVQAYLALHHLALRPLQQLHQRQAGNGLTAAGLAHHAHGLADGDGEADAVHGFDHAGVGEEVGMEVIKLHGVAGIVHLGEVLCLRYVFPLTLLLQLVGDLAVFLGNTAGFPGGHIAVVSFRCHSDPLLSQRFIFGSNASRRPSPTKLKPSTVSIRQIPAGIQMNQYSVST